MPKGTKARREGISPSMFVGFGMSRGENSGNIPARFGYNGGMPERDYAGDLCGRNGG